MEKVKGLTFDIHLILASTMNAGWEIYESKIKVNILPFRPSLVVEHIIKSRFKMWKVI